jgi:hypothetical protein
MANQNAQSGSSSSAPVFNFTLGNEIVGLFRPPAPQLPAAAMPPHIYHDRNMSTTLLLHPSRAPGTDMPISQFCTNFGLGPAIIKKFENNFYMDARVLRFVTMDELKEMDFRLGEIAGLRDAVERWSVPKDG